MKKPENQINPTPIKTGSSENETKGKDQKSKKADFMMTAEEYLTEFTRSNLTVQDLEKYTDKSIAVTGRVKQFSFDPNGYAPPYVTIGAPEIEFVIFFTLDNNNIENRELIRIGETVTLQGIMDETVTWKKPPSLHSGIILKTDY